MGDQRMATGLAAVLVLALGGWFGVWFFDNFEQVEEEITVGFSEKARRNPLLGAERFLLRLGSEVESVTTTDLWRDFPPVATLLFYDFRSPAGERRKRVLRDWLETGGHLIVVADEGVSGEAPVGFLAEFGVRLKKGQSNATAVHTAEVTFAGRKAPVKIAFSQRRHLEDVDGEATAAIEGEEGYHLLQYEVGDGMLTVLSDNLFMTNRHIGKNDHALGLALLVGAPEGGQVWMVNEVVMPSLLELAWGYAPEAAGAMFVLLGLSLWSMGRRLGPLRPPAGGERRDIGEHLQASAQFHWRLDRAHGMFKATQQRTEQAWVAKHLALRPMPQAERCAFIAKRVGLSAAVVERALHGEFRSEDEFITLSGYLQTLGNIHVANKGRSNDASR